MRPMAKRSPQPRAHPVGSIPSRPEAFMATQSGVGTNGPVAPAPAETRTAAAADSDGRAADKTSPESRMTGTSTGGASQAAPASQPPLLFEIAWEVCWQLGGIYT